MATNPEPGPLPGGAILTLGHSTRPLAELIDLLRAHRVETLVDVRRVPRSSRHPHFGGERLAAALAGAGIGYAHAPGLGGLRRPSPASINTAWSNDAFRGFADYMQTDAFAGELDALVERAGRERVAILCAEAAPQRCHRSLIADALVARGVVVSHLLGPGSAERHRLSPRARVHGTRVSYPGRRAAAGDLFDDVEPGPERPASRGAGRSGGRTTRRGQGGGSAGR